MNVFWGGECGCVGSVRLCLASHGNLPLPVLTASHRLRSLPAAGGFNAYKRSAHHTINHSRTTITTSVFLYTLIQPHTQLRILQIDVAIGKQHWLGGVIVCRRLSLGAIVRIRLVNIP